MIGYGAGHYGEMFGSIAEGLVCGAICMAQCTGCMCGCRSFELGGVADADWEMA